MTDPNPVAVALRDVLALDRDRQALLSADDRPKIGYVSIQTPEEIVLAAGAIPFRLTGGLSRDVEDASAHLSSTYCSYVLSCLGEGLAGVYEQADGVIFVDACDMRKRLWEAWQRALPTHDTYFLDLPGEANLLNKRFFSGQLRKLIRALEQRYDRPIGDDALREAITLCNRTRALLRALNEHRKHGRPLLSGADSIGVVKAATSGLKEMVNARLETLVEAVAAAAPPPGRARPRVMICGSHFDHPGIIAAIEDSGVDIVCEDISNGTKYFEGSIKTEGDPVTNIANYYLEKYTSARRIDTDVRLDHLFCLIDDYNVESVIYYVLKFCDTNLHDYPYIKEHLIKRKIRTLFLEGEHNMTNIASLKTRIQTFLEPAIF